MNSFARARWYPAIRLYANIASQLRHDPPGRVIRMRYAIGGVRRSSSALMNARLPLGADAAVDAKTTCRWSGSRRPSANPRRTRAMRTRRLRRRRWRTGWSGEVADAIAPGWGVEI